MLSNLIFKSKSLVRITIQICQLSRSTNIGLKCNTNTLLSFKRSLFQWKRKISPEKYKIKDNIPNEYELIYRSTMETYLYGAQIVCSLSVVFAALLAITNYREDQDYKISSEFVEESTLENEENQMLIFTLGFIFLNLAACYLVSKCPLRIYFNEKAKTYTSVLCGIVPTRRTLITFKPGELKQKSSGLLPWTEFTYVLKNRKSIILLDQYFRKPHDMNVMLGYTKL